MDVQSPIQHVSPKALVPNPLREKARTIPDKQQGRYLMIRDSIIANGIKTPLIVQRNTDTIIGGHTRCEIAIELGLDTVPVQYVDVDYDEALYMLLEDNLDHAEDENDPMKIAWQCQELKRLEGIIMGRPKKVAHNERLSTPRLASKLNMSEQMFRRYVSLNKLIPSLQKLVSEGKIGVVAGNILSGLTVDAQKRVFESIKDVQWTNGYSMTKTEAEGYREAFGDQGENDDSAKSEQSSSASSQEWEELEFYGDESDDRMDEVTTDTNESTNTITEARVRESDVLRILTEPSGPDILGVIKEIEGSSGVLQDDERNRIAVTHKDAEEKLHSLMSIDDKDARRTFSITKVKSAIRTHQLALERAEVDLFGELATLDADSFSQVRENLQAITRASERLAKKLVSVTEEIQRNRLLEA